jgi:O-antigen ligase
LAENPSLAQGVVVNIVYAAMVASLAVVYRISFLELSTYLMAGGIVVSLWLISHDIALTGRTGALYIGENANALGMFAALGLVGAVVLAMRRPFRLLPFLAGLSGAVVCALGVVGSASRGALMVAAGGVAAHALGPTLSRSRGRALVAITGVAVAGVWTVMPALSWFLEKAGRSIGATTNFDAREDILRAAIDAGVSHPLAGVGFGAVEADNIGIFGHVSPHNAYVGMLAATGVLPTVLLGLLVLSAIGRARMSREHHLLPLVVAAAVIGLSLDWVPTAKLGPVALALFARAAALPSVGREDGRDVVERTQAAMKLRP